MARILITIIQSYQRFLSPMLGNRCRYRPSCSQYMMEAVEKHGALRGLLMGTARILRCNPFAGYGDDPVPDHFSLKRNDPEHS